MFRLSNISAVKLDDDEQLAARRAAWKTKGKTNHFVSGVREGGERRFHTLLLFLFYYYHLLLLLLLFRVRAGEIIPEFRHHHRAVVMVPSKAPRKTAPGSYSFARLFLFFLNGLLFVIIPLPFLLFRSPSWSSTGAKRWRKESKRKRGARRATRYQAASLATAVQKTLLILFFFA